MVEIGWKNVSAKIFGLVAEHMKGLPEVGQAFKVKKKETNTVIFDMVEKFPKHNPDERIIATHRTRLMYESMEVWQEERNNSCMLAISEHVANLLATIENPSSTAQALRIVFAATGEVTNPFLTDVKRQETLQIGTTAKPFVLHNGEVVTVTTSLSNMHIMLASRGVQTEITNKAVWPVAWLKLHPGENLFRYGAASGEQSLQVQIWHRQSYGGA